VKAIVPAAHTCSQIDHYALGNLIAHSAAASTYRGTDLRTGRAVAVKFLHPELEGDSLLYQRFQREQEIGRQLEHPSIVKFVFDETRSAAYLVTEWVEGQTLRRILSGAQKLPVERAIRMVVGICDALEYIHGQGVVHRDLKPENIMVGEGDRITLMDFGVASLASARSLTFGKLSQIIGTADYISPEQVHGRPGEARSDIYAAGVILYEMLTGTTPFSGDNPFAIMNNRLIHHPIPPREIDPEISVELQEILYRALERDRKNRYARAREFSWDLRHPDRVGPADRAELEARRPSRAPWAKAVFIYGSLAIMVICAFSLLFYIARHG
jgi:serine/threonine protein kinase